MTMTSQPEKVSEPIQIGAGNKKNDSKRVKVLLAIAAAALVGALLVSRLMGGGASNDTFSLTTPSIAPTTTSTVPVAPSPSPSGLRDPFAKPAGIPTAVVIAPTVVTGTVAATTAGTSTTPATPTASISTTPTTPTTVAAPTPLPTTTGGRVRVTLLEIDAGPTVNVRIDDQVVDGLAVNDTFLGSYRVVSLDVTAHCGVILYGDQRLALCEGDEAVL
jgi:hypothetical protein